MPVRLHAPDRLKNSRPARAAAAVLLLAALAGCGGTGQAAPPVPASPPDQLDAAGLAGLADDRPPTALPTSTTTARQVADALLARQPAPGPVGPFSVEQARDALAVAARIVAATRADPRYLCGPPDASALTDYATPSLAAWLADPANADARVEAETTISASGTTGDCGPLQWIGPGIVPGPQTWTTSPGAGGRGLDVAWTGSMGYALADASGAPEPWGMRGRVTYRLVQDADGAWRVDGWADGASGRVAQGWPHDIEVPGGYLPAPPVPAADPKALDAVRGAADAWAAAPASTVTVEQAVDGPAGPGTSAATATSAPARGDAAGEAGGTRMLWLGHGHRALTASTDEDKPWTERDATAPVEFGVSAPVSPFAVAALLADVDAAAPAECPDGLPATRCFTAVLATADPEVALAADTGLARRAGIPWLVLDVGVDSQGRPAHVRLPQQAVAFGEPYASLTSTARYTAYPAAPPPPPAVPGPADVASAADGDQ